MHKVKESRDVEYLDVTFDPIVSVCVAIVTLSSLARNRQFCRVKKG